MATRHPLHRTIEQSMSDLPREALEEVALSIDFQQVRECATRIVDDSEIEHALRQLDLDEAQHLEQEFSAYQDQYPSED